MITGVYEKWKNRTKNRTTGLQSHAQRAVCRPNGASTHQPRVSDEGAPPWVCAHRIRNPLSSVAEERGEGEEEAEHFLPAGQQIPIARRAEYGEQPVNNFLKKSFRGDRFCHPTPVRLETNMKTNQSLKQAGQRKSNPRHRRRAQPRSAFTRRPDPRKTDEWWSSLHCLEQCLIHALIRGLLRSPKPDPRHIVAEFYALDFIVARRYRNRRERFLREQRQLKRPVASPEPFTLTA